MKCAVRDTKLPGPSLVSLFSVLFSLLIHLLIESFPSLTDPVQG